MIVFDLRCGGGHVFEAWFGSTGDYEAQGTRGLISCPICGNGEIVKAAMAPAVPAKGNRLVETADRQPSTLLGSNRSKGHPASNGNEVAAADSTAGENLPSPAETKAMLKALAAAQAHVEANCDYVGERFAATARAIHDGDAAPRGIYGEATRAEAATLLADGIAVAPLPFRSRRNSDA